MTTKSKMHPVRIESGMSLWNLDSRFDVVRALIGFGGGPDLNNELKIKHAWRLATLTLKF